MRSSDGNDKSTPKTKRWVPWLTIAATILIVAVCATIIWYRYIITPAPDCTITVAGDKILDGSTVVVIPKVAADPEQSRYKVKLNEQNQYSARFFLNSGTYQIMILRPDGSAALDITDFIPPGRSWRYEKTAQYTGLRGPSTTKAAPER